MARLLALLLAAPPLCGAAVLSTGKERPVMKVVRLLQDMQAELQHELEDDRAVHEAMTCWCKTNDQEKTKAIEQGEALSEQLQATMGESIAKVKQLKQKRKATLDEVYANQKALGEATELRMKANKAFHSETADLMEAVAATKQAVVVLSKHHPELAQLRTVAQRLDGAKVPRLAATALRQDQMAALRSFLRQAAQASSFLAIPGFQSYAPQSGQIYGILQQMQEDFEHSLSDAQQAEQKAVNEYEALKAAKESEIAAGQQTVVDLDAAIAEFGEKAVRAEKQLADTQEQLALDRTFLENLRKQCSESEAEFDARVKSRTDEISAVQEAIQILNSEEAFGVFGAAVGNGPSLLQKSATSEQERQRRQRASAILHDAAARAGAPQLALLAVSAQLDAFTKVKESIDNLVSTLQKQQKDEVAHRDWCIDELATNDRATAAADDKKSGLQAKIADLDKTIDSLTSQIESSTAAMAELQVQMKRASETREGENADFQQTAIDQHLTQEILTKALKRLQQVYALVQGPGAPHIQTSGDHTNPGNGPARFTKYEQNAGGSRALQLIQDIIDDSKKTEAEAMRSEADAQTAYENFMKDANESIIAQTKAVSDMTAARAQSEESLVLAKSDLKQTMSDLENLSLTAGDLHKSCDYILKNFSTRQEARSEEMEALRQAKAILSGMQ